MNVAMDQSAKAMDSPSVVIVGAGISGLCMAIKLKQAGIDDITILEKTGDVGGTWLHNTYPGCACDVPSMLYSFSFELKYDWSRKYAPQSEILDYLRHCADKFNVRKHIQFNTAVEEAKFDEAANVWRINTSDGEQLEASIFISAVGQLSRPKMPQIDGLDTYQGEAFHTANWNHDFDYEDKEVAVVGNGASAIQVVPELAKKARKVRVFQRSPNWIARRYDYPYPGIAQAALRWIPGLAKLHRLWFYLQSDARIFFYQRRNFLNNGFTAWVKGQMKKRLPQKLHSTVIPSYPAGCKRVLLSNNYLESLSRDNVEVTPHGVSEITPGGLRAGDKDWQADAIVFATGFESSQFLVPMQITGRDGADLHHAWEKRPKTYMGMLAAGFPNFFMLYGPNTNLGHSSIIFMVECQVRYIVKCLKAMQQQNAASIEVKPAAVKAFDKQLQKELKQKVWNGYVSSWYKTADGHIVNNWSGSTTAYEKVTRRPDETAFEFRQQAGSSAVNQLAQDESCSDQEIRKAG